MTNTIDIILNELACGSTISEALTNVYSKRHVVLPYNSKWFNTDVRKLDMNSRIINALMRAHLRTINDIIKFVENGNRITDIRAMGTESCGKLMEIILDHAWERMDVNERAEFLLDVVERNEVHLK